ncbi:MAG: hypothetical protein ABFD90_18300 [Phycisphaerales bacterium]
MNPGNGHEGISMDWVQRQLRAISAVEPPESLKGRLLAGIPAIGEGQPATRYACPWLRWARWAGVAAAVVVTASVVAWLGVPSGRQSRPIADINGASSGACATDHNSPRPSDTNLCDINSL